MGTNKTWFLVLCFICYFNSSPCQSVLEDYPVLESTTKARIELLKIAASQVGVKETSENDGKQIRKYQKAAGIPKGSPWCVAFVVWCHLEYNYDLPIVRSGYSPDMFKTNVVYFKFHKRVKEWKPRGGEVGGKYYESKGRVAHVFIIEKKWGRHYHTYEGNTSLLGAILDGMNVSDDEKEDRDGAFVAHKIRQESDLHIASDHIGVAEINAYFKKKRK